MSAKSASVFDSLEIVKPGEEEFDCLWSKLAKHSLNKKIKDPQVAENFGEVWQYMNTQECSYLWFFKRKFHIFRHRCHPKKNSIVCLKIPVSKNYKTS